MRIARLSLFAAVAVAAAAVGGGVTARSFSHGGQTVFDAARSELADSSPAAAAAAVATHPAYPDRQLRVKEPTICDPGVQQYSGYLDHTDADKHFFFWFFESHNRPERDPLILWINGGPGCSSFTGLLMELGPCRAAKGGNDTVPNPFGWNQRANVVFLDQPMNTGFSHGSDVFDSPSAAADVHTFLQLFLRKFPKYANAPIVAFGESYGGHYIPEIARVIHEANKRIVKRAADDIASGKLVSAAAASDVAGWTAQSQLAAPVAANEERALRLSSIGIGNGLIDPLVQYKYYSKMACNSTYGPILPESECKAMDNAYPTCARLIKACYSSRSRFACVPAELYCNSQILGRFQKSGKNIYDIRDDCPQGGMCYSILDDIETYLNQKEVRAALGVDPEVEKFVGCNTGVHAGFRLKGDWMQPFHLDLVPLLDLGLRVLLYHGDADFICSYMGGEQLALELEWAGKEGYNAAEVQKWIVDEKEAGEVRTFGPLTFVRAYGGGHMLPYDQPENSLDLINRWILSRPYA